MGGLLSSMFGGDQPDTSAQDARIAEQDKKIAKQEARQAGELKARRTVASRGSKSQTLFSQVLGTDDSIKSKLGE